MFFFQIDEKSRNSLKIPLTINSGEGLEEITKETIEDLQMLNHEKAD